jgi:hypothetical protein
MSPRKPANTERINVFFSADALAKLHQLADSKGTTISGVVRMIVLEHLAEQK